MIKKGVWFLYSEKDKRWCCTGIAFVGGFEIPPQCQKKLDELKQKLGEPPDDLEWGYEKY